MIQPSRRRNKLFSAYDLNRTSTLHMSVILNYDSQYDKLTSQPPYQLILGKTNIFLHDYQISMMYIKLNDIWQMTNFGKYV
jgi:hypothetical protein